MNKYFNRIVLPGIVVGMMGITTSALAEWGDHDCGPGMGRDHGDMAQMRDLYQHALHDKLKLNADQEKAWQTFIAKGKELRPHDRPDPKELDSLNAPQRMEKMLEHGRDREQRMETMLASLKNFYGVLTPEQQKIFDDSMHRPGKHHMGDKWESRG
jgi:periplasmic protein CpxP/Spy